MSGAKSCNIPGMPQMNTLTTEAVRRAGDVVCSSSSVAVIIVNWNGMPQLPACLLALSRQEYPDVEIIVVDNGSQDDSVAFIAENYPTVRILQNRTNTGFAAACNQGIQATAAEFIALQNIDTVVHPGWIGAMVARMADPDVGMCACKLLLMTHGSQMIDSLGVAVDRLGYAWGIAGGQPDAPALTPPAEQLLGPSGGAGLYRRRMLVELGGFDADFFAYLEDVDLAWRAQWAGWRCAYAPDAIVYHLHSATSTRIPGLKSRLLARNRIWMVAKNYPAGALLRYLPLFIVFEIGALLYVARQRRLRSSLRGRLEALVGLPAMLARRRQTPRRISSTQMLARLRPIQLPRAMLKRYSFVAQKQR
jgi:GT2 family glycosyltransferase